MAVATAVVFVWVGMVVAISFLEAPLKFRAPGVTTTIGLGIGRLVFGALNVAELLLAAVAVVALAVGGVTTGLAVAVAAPVVVLLAQLLAVRPRLRRHSDAVRAGADPPRSRAHLVYIALEVAKLVALVVAGVCCPRCDPRPTAVPPVPCGDTVRVPTRRTRSSTTCPCSTWWTTTAAPAACAATARTSAAVPARPTVRATPRVSTPRPDRPPASASPPTRRTASTSPTAPADVGTPRPDPAQGPPAALSYTEFAAALAQSARATHS